MSDSSGRRPRLLYLLTDQLSSVLVRGQLGFMIEQGFDVEVAVGGEVRADAWDQGVSVSSVPLVRQPSPLRDLRALWAIVALIRRSRPDVVNASTPKAGLLGMVAAFVCRVPVRVYVVRGYRFEGLHGPGRWLAIAVERVTSACATDVIVNSASLRAVGWTSGALARSRGVVLAAGSGNGVDIERFSPASDSTTGEARQQFGLPIDSTVVGFVGRLVRDKGIVDLVDVFSDRFGDVDDVWLLLVGSFEDADRVPPETRRAIESHARTVVVPWMDRPETAYAAMDVLVFPSFREGLPNAPLEAQASGVPVVGYAATGTVDAVPSEWLVAVGDCNSLGALLATLVNEPTRRRDVAAAQRSRVGQRFEQSRLWAALAGRYGMRTA
ncbi:MAG: glycosyltransferase [Actinomycetota bacterium]